MNSCILMAEIVEKPELRHTTDGVEQTEMMVQFPGLRADDPPAMLRVVSWGNLAREVYQTYRPGDRVVLEGRLGMITVERRPEGFKEKRAELTLQKIHSWEGAGNNSSSDAEKYETPAHTPVTTGGAPVASGSPRPVATPAASSVGVSNYDREEPIPQATTSERTAYPVTTPQEDMDDDIPF